MQIGKFTKCSTCGKATPGRKAWNDHQYAEHPVETKMFDDLMTEMTVPSKRFPGLREARKDWMTYTPKI